MVNRAKALKALKTSLSGCSYVHLWVHVNIIYVHSMVCMLDGGMWEVCMIMDLCQGND